MIVRWRIEGTFTTTAPMHVGSGAVTKNEHLLNEKKKTHCDVQAVVKDYRCRPCIPGSAIKGVLRAWATAHFNQPSLVTRIFGDENQSPDAESGWAEFGTATFKCGIKPEAGAHVPYWNEDTQTGIACHVAINRKTGAAEENKLFFEEYVPAGTTFAVEIDATRLTDDEIAFLLAVLEQGCSHPTQPYQFGANGADGWGRGTWTTKAVYKWTPESPPVPPDSIGFACCTIPHTATVPELPPKALDCVVMGLTLKCDGPFLVNDAAAAQAKKKDEAKTDEKKRKDTDFYPLRHPNESVWLPASSVRGVLRERAEFLANSQGNQGNAESVKRLFGTTGRQTAITLTEIEEVGRSNAERQDFVAIDRFTGGAADGAKFDATYAERPTFRTTIVLDRTRLEPEDEKLFAAVLHDVREGRLTFGAGGSRGYGWMTGTLDFRGEPPFHPLLEPKAESNVMSPSTGPKLIADVMQLELDKNGKQKRYLKSLRTTANKTVPWAAVSKDLQDPAMTPGEYPVEYELENGQPVRIRAQGKEFVGDPKQTPKKQAMTSPPNTDSNRFYNPYYFLTMKDRTGFTGDLADHEPVTHDRYDLDRFSGTIRVRLTTKTPLLLLCDDESKAIPVDTIPVDSPKDKHLQFRVRLGADDRPLLASSSVRGMLRAAYEAVTNSRFGVFPTKASKGNDLRLGYRSSARSGLDTVPVRIETVDGRLKARLLPGTTPIGPNGRPSDRDAPVYAACVAMYDRAWRMPGVEHVRHGVRCWAFVGPWQHDRFRFWNVETVCLNEQRPTSPPNDQRFRPSRRTARQSDWAEPHWVEGWLCVTERNIDGKHDERFFFGDSSAHAELDPSVGGHWERLIADYQIQHEEELKRGITRPPALNESCRFSRHITHDLSSLAEDERTLRDGTLCYASVQKLGNSFVVTALYPVMIARKLYRHSPRELLPVSLLPAPNRESLSPADRVFGWVGEDDAAGKNPAHRSQLRVGVVTCETESAVEDFGDKPKTLAILGQPKPAQGRFYLGNADGTAQKNGGSKEDRGYTDPKQNRIRGPKVFLHHATGIGPQAYSDERSNQNRSVSGWVKPETVFEFDLRVSNLTKLELGALVWLLTLPDAHHLRLGLGKPLGFGSVRATIVTERTTVATGREWVEKIGTSEQPHALSLESLASEFDEAMKTANPNLLEAFKKAAKGFTDCPVQYPTLSPSQATRDAEHFEWFTANEREGRTNPGLKLVLPDIHAKDPSLPRDPSRS